MVVRRRILTGIALWAVAGLAFAGPVNVNQADAAALAEGLDGVGEVKAQAIVEYRESNGPFRAPEDLSEVTGIGEKTVANNRDNILLKPTTP